MSVPPRPLPTTPRPTTTSSSSRSIVESSSGPHRPPRSRPVNRGKSFDLRVGGPEEGLNSSERNLAAALTRRAESSPSSNQQQQQPALSLPVNPPSFSRSSSTDTTASASSAGGYSSYLNTQASLALPPRSDFNSQSNTSSSSSKPAALLPSLLPPPPSSPQPSTPTRTTAPSPTSSRFQNSNAPPRSPSSSLLLPLPPSLTTTLPVSPSPDSPAFRSTLLSLSLRLASLKTHVKHVQRSAAHVSELLLQLSDAEEELAKGMQELGGCMDDPASASASASEMGANGRLRGAWGVGGVVGRRRKERREEREALERTVVGPLKSFYELVKEGEKEKMSRKGYEEESKSYLSYTAKYLSSPASKDSPNLDAAFRARNLQWDLYRFELHSHLLNLTLGPQFESLRVHLLTFPSQLLTFTSPSPSAREDLERTLAEASERNLQVQEWWELRQTSHRALLDVARGGGSAVADDESSWENFESGGGLELGGYGNGNGHGHERKRDRLGSKIRAAFSSGGGNASNSNDPSLLDTIAAPFRNFNNNNNSNRSSSPTFQPSPSSSSSNPNPNPIPPPLSLQHPTQSIASPEVKRPSRHSIQVLPKSYSSSSSAAGLVNSGNGNGNGNAALKGIRDLADGSIRWADLREKEGRKKEGYLWCAGEGGREERESGSGRARGGWERCWCEVKQSQLIEYRSGSEGVEFASTTDLMFASAREARKSDRRFVIELITRKSTRRFQATSELDMNRWLAALGNAIEASINGTASIRGFSNSSIPTLSSIDDLGLLLRTPHGLGLGLPINSSQTNPNPTSPSASSPPLSSSAFPAFRAWGNPLSRKSSANKRASKGQGLYPHHASSPSEGGAAMFASSSSSPFDGTSPGGISHRDYHHPHRYQDSTNSTVTTTNDPKDGIPPFFSSNHRSTASTSYSTSTQQPPLGPTFHITSPSPAPTPPPSAQKLSHNNHHHPNPTSFSSSPYHLAQVRTSPSRLSMTIDRSESGEGSRTGESSSRRSSSSCFLEEEQQQHGGLDGIERRVNELALGGGGSGTERRALSEGRTFGGGNGEEEDGKRKRVLPSILEISKREGNRNCVDCGRPNPRWATIAIHDARLVGFMCIECSGVHRSLGSHISKVRSVDLDNWKDEDILAADRTGNTYLNSIWETQPPEPEERANMKAFIQSKYVDGRWRSA